MEDVDSEQTNSVFPEHPEKSNTPEQKVPQENIGHTVTLTVTVALACTKCMYNYTIFTLLFLLSYLNKYIVVTYL